MFDNLLNPILSPILAIPALASIAIISIVISVIMVLAYKLMTDQHVMKNLKDELSKHRDEMKKCKDDPKKMMDIQKRSMQVNLEYMKRSMKPTLVTMIPILIIFGWISAHYAYEPIQPGQDFITTAVFQDGITGQAILIAPEGLELKNNATQQIQEGQANWTLQAKTNGEHLMEIQYNQEPIQTKDVLVSEKQEYAQPIKTVEQGSIKEIKIEMKKNKPLNLFGWKVGWLGTYIMISLVVSLGLRKIMKLA